MFSMPSPNHIILEYFNDYFISQDAKYYRRLLNDPSIQKKIEAHLGKEAQDWEKYFCLFTDPKTKKQHSSKNIREGILPRPFYLLRFMHALLSTESRDRKEKAGLDNTPCETTSELSLKPIKQRWTITDWPILERTLKKVTESLHTATFNNYRTITLESNIPGFNTLYKKNYRRHLRTNLFTSKADLSSYKLYNLTNEKIIDADYIKMLFLDAGFRKQDEIMHHTIPSNLPVEKPEIKILEMVTSYKSDQVIRSISYFT